ncbi:hypothetical protein [Lactobacillus sp. B4007]|uniref:hypothetical protein n=1 Tax=Lactobacillus sp. B4007 TaxID=2818032 RepID=UPI002269F879|nr:hypothetical protein [Lactobacillus sp. B4007]MCX8725108.1 hypothetical protein [Lactobacillus sp. B4007]
MTERAFSTELNRSISAKEASELSRKDELNDSKAFKCVDKNCGIPLTCTNWKQTGKRYYFTPSSKNDLHIVDCTEVSESESAKQAEKEAQGAKSTIQKNGLIKMTKSLNKAVTNIGATNDSTDTSSPNKTSSRANTSGKIGRESRNIYSVASFVDLFKDNNLDNNTQIVSIKSKKGNEELSLNELFVPATNKRFDWGKIRIFYGKAFLSNTTRGKDMVEIRFYNSILPKIYSNISELKKRAATSNITEFLDKNVKATVYFRGKLIDSGRKLYPYNDTYYKDLLFR